MISATAFSQEINQKTTDEKSGEEILIGLCNKQGLLQEPFSDWFKRGYEAYMPDAKVLAQLKQYNGKWKVVLVLGTWCHDSHLQVPRFVKILELIDCKSNNLKMLCVDAQKKCDDANIAGMKIDKVPTFIIYSGETEIGRIIETPTNTLESDLLQILQKQ